MQFCVNIVLRADLLVSRIIQRRGVTAVKQQTESKLESMCKPFLGTQLVLMPKDFTFLFLPFA